MLLKDKRAYRELTGMFIIGLAAVGLVIAIYMGTAIFFGVIVDVRMEEAQALNDRLFSVIVMNGELQEDVLKNDFNILERARLDKKIIGDKKDAQNFLFFQVDILSDGESVKKFIEGNRDYREMCGLSKEGEIKCVQEKLVLSDGYVVEILTASNQRGERV
ncbi:MAG: hypothetical protein ABIH37_05635 [archaeon]